MAMTATYKQICQHVFSGEPSRDDLINQLTEYRIKHEVACSTLELVKERIAEAHRALAAQCKHTKELEAERDELKADAMRYRWLMNDDGHNALMATLASLCATDDPIKPQMDAAIDAAIAKVMKP